MAVELTPDGISYLMSGAASAGDGFKKPIVQVRIMWQWQGAIKHSVLACSSSCHCTLLLLLP